MLAIVQLDAVSPALLDELVEAGRMPVLAALRADGTSLPLETPATLFPAGTYQSIYTGLEPAEHGRYYGFQWVAREQRVRFREELPPVVDVWERLARAGSRALVVDPYETERPRALEGAMLSGIGLWNPISMRRFGAPDGAWRDAVRRHGKPPLLTEIFGKPSPGALAAIRAEALLGARRVGEVVVDALARDRYDLVWASILSTHLAGHQLWDASQVGEEAWQRAGLADGLREVYAAADAALGRIVDALPEHADLIVCSPQGMGPNPSRVDLLPGMLAAVLGERGAEEDAGGGVWRFRASVPTSARAAISRALPEGVVRSLYASLAVRGIDWSRTRAFALPADHFGHVQLNVRGRERDGIVDPAEVDGLADRIAAGLLAFRDEDGGPAVDSVVRVAHELDGPGVASLPDLVVRWSGRPATRLRAVVSPEHGIVRRVGAGSGRSGGHTAEAWALVRPGRSRLLAEGRGRVVDLAATACALLGADASGLAGSPLLG